ncbi:MoaD/ThiS family protein [Archaeoglobus fulgidus]|uniref:Molybdopterin converting factor, small subunit n=2 Tax=Archaeoglobus fulgidus TaxID=2234 RepID=A0A075WA43_ARCFL|nr:MoaD/ThiS family protein [Archaeoglobus fulgidus]AIG96866.1 Molybdopterin converting factor, small subunit [Archaeoglobus fulgidus DSM 8774]
MKIKVTLSAVQFRSLVDYESRSFHLDLGEGSTLGDAVRAVEEMLSAEIEPLLERGNVRIMMNNSLVDYQNEKNRVLNDGDVLIFITPISGG